MFSSSGTIEAFPFTKSTPHRQGSWWMVLHCDEEIGRYYRSLHNYMNPLKLLAPEWGAHITVIRDEQPTKPDDWYNWNGKRVTYTYEPVLKDNEQYFWLSVKCDELLDVREALGLYRFPQYSLHLTVGRNPFVR